VDEADAIGSSKYKESKAEEEKKKRRTVVYGRFYIAHTGHASLTDRAVTDCYLPAQSDHARFTIEQAPHATPTKSKGAIIAAFDWLVRGDGLLRLSYLNRRNPPFSPLTLFRLEAYTLAPLQRSTLH